MKYIESKYKSQAISIYVLMYLENNKLNSMKNLKFLLPSKSEVPEVLSADHK
jgi:hypothetical protein